MNDYELLAAVFLIFMIAYIFTLTYLLINEHRIEKINKKNNEEEVDLDYFKKIFTKK